MPAQTPSPASNYSRVLRRLVARQRELQEALRDLQDTITLLEGLEGHAPCRGKHVTIPDEATPWLSYEVTRHPDGAWSCTCPSSRHACKHILAAQHGDTR